MTQDEAYKVMRQGYKVANVTYSPDEFVFINKHGRLETEDGYSHGGRFDEFWNDIQSKLPQEWLIYGDITVAQELAILENMLQPNEGVVIRTVGDAHTFASNEAYIIRDTYKLNHKESYVNLDTDTKWYKIFDKKRKKRR